MSKEKEKFEYPCICGHLYKFHEIITESHGFWDMDSEENEVWREEPEYSPVCYSCNLYCDFERMDSLKYLEWKYDLQKGNK